MGRQGAGGQRCCPGSAWLAPQPQHLQREAGEPPGCALTCKLHMQLLALRKRAKIEMSLKSHFSHNSSPVFPLSAPPASTTRKKVCVVPQVPQATCKVTPVCFRSVQEMIRRLYDSAFPITITLCPHREAGTAFGVAERRCSARFCCREALPRRSYELALRLPCSKPC